MTPRYVRSVRSNRIWRVVGETERFYSVVPPDEPHREPVELSKMLAIGGELPAPDPATRQTCVTIPTIAFDLESGADWDTVLWVVQDKQVRVELCDGTSAEGVVGFSGRDEVIFLRHHETGRSVSIHFDHVYRIVVT